MRDELIGLLIGSIVLLKYIYLNTNSINRVPVGVFGAISLVVGVVSLASILIKLYKKYNTKIEEKWL